MNDCEAIPKWYYELNSKQRQKVNYYFRQGLINKLKYQTTTNPIKAIYFQIRSNWLSYKIEKELK